MVKVVAFWNTREVTVWESSCHPCSLLKLQLLYALVGAQKVTGDRGQAQVAQGGCGVSSLEIFKSL